MLPPAIAQRIKDLNPDYREYILSEMPKLITQTFSEAQNFTDEQGAILENGFSLYLLFFFDLNLLANFIATECKINIGEATLLTQALDLALPEDIRSIHQNTIDQIDFNNSNSVSVNTMMTEIAKTEAVLETISPIRTMSGDSKINPNQEGGTYTSMQSAILREGN